MTATIQECLNHLQSELEMALVDTYTKAVYAYRKFPDALDVELSLSYQGGAPAGSTSGGSHVRFYDVTAVIGAASDGSEASLAAAEAALNALENAIYDQLTGDLRRTVNWEKVSFPAQSVRPPSFVDAPTLRYGEIPFRLHLT